MWMDEYCYYGEMGDPPESPISSESAPAPTDVKEPAPAPSQRVASLEYAVRLAVSSQTDRRVYYIPDPKPGKPQHMIWLTKTITDTVPPAAKLYCHITKDGEVLHSYAHIIHPFVGDSFVSACKVCKGYRSDRIHLGIIKADMAEFFKWAHPQGVTEIPIDEIYTLEPQPAATGMVGN